MFVNLLAKMALKGMFVSYNFKNSKIFNLEEEVMPAGKFARSVGLVSTLANLPVTSVMYRNGVFRVS